MADGYTYCCAVDGRRQSAARRERRPGPGHAPSTAAAAIQHMCIRSVDSGGGRRRRGSGCRRRRGGRLLSGPVAWPNSSCSWPLSAPLWVSRAMDACCTHTHTCTAYIPIYLVHGCAARYAVPDASSSSSPSPSPFPASAQPHPSASRFLAIPIVSPTRRGPTQRCMASPPVRPGCRG